MHCVELNLVQVGKIADNEMWILNLAVTVYTGHAWSNYSNYSTLAVSKGSRVFKLVTTVTILTS